jgi:hypothetical protein
MDAEILDMAEEEAMAGVDMRTDSVEKSMGASRDPKDDCAPSMSGSARRKRIHHRRAASVLRLVIVAGFAARETSSNVDASLRARGVYDDLNLTVRDALLQRPDVDAKEMMVLGSDFSQRVPLDQGRELLSPQAMQRQTTIIDDFSAVEMAQQGQRRAPNKSKADRSRPWATQNAV